MWQSQPPFEVPLPPSLCAKFPQLQTPGARTTWRGPCAMGTIHEATCGMESCEPRSWDPRHLPQHGQSLLRRAAVRGTFGQKDNSYNMMQYLQWAHGDLIWFDDHGPTILGHLATSFAASQSFIMSTTQRLLPRQPRTLCACPTGFGERFCRVN